ncbi:LysE family translocator [Psychromonas sp. KJ10-2]|uniref:LysE family translocator n=1 Tax=Psychromonas sp. KJ10-2 TaxID=3391822 RepID=UPI0039B6A113
MDIQVAIAFIFFAISMSLTPGGGNITLLGISNRHGFSAALPFVAGTAFGVLVIFAGVSAGLLEVLTHYPSVYLTLKLLGAAYLLYVAWCMASFQFKEVNSETKSPGFLSGFGIQVLNPKAWVAAMTAFSQFINLSEDYNTQVMTITSVFLVIMTLCTLSWAYFGVMMKKLLRSPQQIFIVNRVLSLTLVITVVFMLSN